MTGVVGYVRVSTRGQKSSGLGLEAQTERITQFCSAEGLTVIKWFEDTQSGAGTEEDNFRPGLASALEFARERRCSVIVARLDRLSRSVRYISTLVDEQVPFICCDLGLDTDQFTLHIFAALGEKERRLISERTKSALAAKRERGQRLGNPNLSAVRELAHERRAAIANEFAAKMLPTITAFQGQGSSLRQIAVQMNNSGLVTQRHGRWTAMQVSRVLDRKCGLPQAATVTKPPVRPNETAVQKAT